MVLQNYKKIIEMTANMIYIVALGVGLKCLCKIHLNIQCPLLKELLHCYRERPAYCWHFQYHLPPSLVNVVYERPLFEPTAFFLWRVWTFMWRCFRAVHTLRFFPLFTALHVFRMSHSNSQLSFVYFYILVLNEAKIFL